MRDWASELRAIADGRLMLNVRNGVTVSRSMLAMIADEIDALRAAPLAPAEVGGHANAQTEARAIARLIERLNGEADAFERGSDETDPGTAALLREAATALAAKDAELEKVKAECDKWREAFGEMHRQTMRAEAQLAEARKAQNYLNDAVFAGLDHLEIARRAKILVNAARRALTGGQEDG